MKKAFDTVKHDKLFTALAKVGLPEPIFEVLRIIGTVKYLYP